MKEEIITTDSGRVVRTADDAINEANRLFSQIGRVKAANTAAYLGLDIRPRRVCSCQCASPDMADGMNVVLLKRPRHMYPTERGHYIEVDRCVAPVVEHIWAQGVWTGGACCGHTVRRPTIAVFPESEALMVSLGYEAHEDASHIFYVDNCAREMESER